MPTSTLKSRWKKARPGSVLILVIALLVLLALLGTAYLSSTQTERYSSQQNSVNTEADLLVQGLIDATQSSIVNGLFGSTSSGTQFRPAGQEMPTYGGTGGLQATAAPASSGYHSYTSPASELYLSPRGPNAAANPLGGTPQSASIPFWDSTSWPLFPDGSGSYSYDSPFDGSAPLFLASNKGQVQAWPTYRSFNGQIYPAMLYFIPANTSSQVVLQEPSGSGYLRNHGGRLSHANRTAGVAVYTASADRELFQYSRICNLRQLRRQRQR